MSRPALLELRGIVVRAGGRTILDVPQLALAPAGATAVLGANGAGKSTLLRVAGALIRPTAGDVLLDGAPATPAAIRRVSAAVLQRPLLRRATVRENAETGLRFHRVPRAEARRRAEEWLERLGVARLAHRAAHTLSAGEAQRVSLARALALSPRLLLLDEPFAGLDAPTRGELLVDLGEALAGAAAAALLVTHDRHEAAALAERLAILHAGQLRHEGQTAEVWAHPADADCARILGYDTVLEPDVARRVVPGRARPLALRSEDCVAAPPGSDRNGSSLTISARLRRVIPLGATSRVVADVDGRRLLATAPAPAPEWLAALRPGDAIDVRLERERARPVGGACRHAGGPDERGYASREWRSR
ncbi:MAG TPA: ATP-binding cassette domain-containing protein [Thermoleophilaceae bacterium]|nr:ATP-binding cassette domain-containing protein [Thermoleophilaceae bacterium]